MPYYCTVPRCTSMAGKAKNVSFHQFPRDVKLAKLWNDILKRGKPYTKYSKVCSLHFTPEDYVITSAGKNKGQWRTLRKDALPSQNLPLEPGIPYQRSEIEPWMSAPSPLPAFDPQVQQQIAHAFYVQTMIAMQQGFASGIIAPPSPASPPDQESSSSHTISQPTEKSKFENVSVQKGEFDTTSTDTTRCEYCSKCFKDPDVLLLHKRSHKCNENGVQTDKENFNLNTLKPEMLKSNPILANLLKNTVEKNVFNTDLLVSISDNMRKMLTGVAVNDYDCDNSVSDNDNDSLDDDNDKLVINDDGAQCFTDRASSDEK